MKEIPQYESHEQVRGETLPSMGALANKPVPKGQEPIQPYLEAAKADIDYFSRYAENSSHALAKSLGELRGQKPGGFMIPPIFESQKTFYEAYKAEELQNLNFEGQKALTGMQQLAGRNPTPNGLLSYQKQGSMTVQEILDTASPGNKAALKRSLTAKYDSGTLGLSEAIYNKNKAKMKSEANVRNDVGLTQIYDSAAEGNEVLTNETFDMRKRDLGNQLYKEEISQEEYHKQIKALEETRRNGKYAGKAKEWIKDDNFQEKMRDFVENNPDKLSPSNHQEVTQSMMRFHNQFEAARKGDQYLAYMDTRTAISGGQMPTPSQLETAKERMGRDYAAQIDLEIGKKNAKETLSLQNHQNFLDNIDNSSYQSQLNDKQFAKQFNQLVRNAESRMGLEPGAMPIAQQLELSQEIPRTNNVLAKQFNNDLKGGSPQRFHDAAMAYSNPNNKNNLTLLGVDKDAQARAYKYENKIAAGHNPEIAYQMVNEDFANLSPQQLEAREQKFTELTKKNSDYDMSTFDNTLKLCAKNLDFPKAQFPEELPLIWKNEVEDNFKRTNDMDSAMRMANKSIKDIYGIRKDRVMKLPPERYIQNYPLAESYIDNQIFDSAKEVFKEYKDIYDKHKEQDYYYEFDVKEVGSTNILEAKYQENRYMNLYKGGPIKARKIYRNGEIQKGIIDIQADSRSLRPQDGNIPNYYVGFITEQSALPLKDPRNQFSPLRYKPDFTNLNTEMKRLEEEDLDLKRHSIEYVKQRNIDYKKYLELTGELD